MDVRLAQLRVPSSGSEVGTQYLKWGPSKVGMGKQSFFGGGVGQGYERA